jgi:dephospho-CoA kinase
LGGVLILKKIAVTGNPSVGKTTVCSFFKKFGAFVVSSDEIVDALLSTDILIRKKIVELLGSDIIFNNQINKEKISKLVFSNYNKLFKLESILHPRVKQTIHKLYEKVKKNPSYTFFVAEIPLLFEANMESDFDIIFLITTDPSIAKQRSNKNHFSTRSKRFDDTTTKTSKVDFIIENNGNLNLLQKKLKQCLHL